MWVKSFGKKIGAVVVVFMFFGGSLFGTPTGTVLDIFDIQVDAINKNFTKNADKIASSMMDSAKLAFELSDVNVDPDSIVNATGNNIQHDKLIKIVDAVYDAWQVDTRTSLVANLNKISNVAEAYKNVIGLTRSVGDLENAANELGKEIYKNSNIINLLQKKDYKAIRKLVDKGSDLYNVLDNITKLDSNVLVGLTQKEVANHWANEVKDEVGQKLYIQELLIKRWQENGTIDRLGIEDVKQLNIYSPMDSGGIGGLFGKRELESVRRVSAEYSLLSQDDIYLIESGYYDTKNDTSDKNLKLKKDKNEEKLKELSEKDKKLKDKIKTVKNKEKDLKSKNERLRGIRDEKRAAFDRVKSAEKGSDEYNYAKNRFFSLSDDYRSLNKETEDLIDSIDTDRSTLKTMQKDITDTAINLKSSVDDYNDYFKKDIFIEPQEGIYEQDWRGSFTFKAEEQSGVLVYTGGNWGTTEEYLQYGASELFKFENDNPNIVKSGYFEHGTNTDTDNTKQFDIIANGTNTNIKSLDISQDVGNGNTLSFKEKGYYNYTVWGEWGQTGGLKTEINGGSGLDLTAQHNNWIVGEVTKDLPTQGSATYTGVVNGHYYVNSVDSDYGGSVHGTMNMTVDFANNSVVTGPLNLIKQDNSTFATATMDNMQIDRNSRAFTGRLIGDNIAPLQTNIVPAGASYNNQINGSFYGQNAEEVGGTWKVSNTNNNYASGTFAGER